MKLTLPGLECGSFSIPHKISVNFFMYFSTVIYGGLCVHGNSNLHILPMIKQQQLVFSFLATAQWARKREILTKIRFYDHEQTRI